MNIKKFVFVIVFLSSQFLFLLTPSVVYAQPYPSPTHPSSYYNNSTTSNTSKSSSDSLLLKGISEVTKDHKVSVATFLFWLSSAIPKQWLSEPGRADFYVFLNTHFPFLNIPIPLPFIIPLVFIGPIGSLIVFVLVLIFLYKLIRHFILPVIIPIVLYLLGRLGLKIKVKSRDQTFLELTFPSDTTKSAFATDQLYALLHSQSRQHGFLEGLMHYKKSYSLEIVSTRDEGIRYVMVVPSKEADVFRSNLLSFLPGVKIRKIDDYLSAGAENTQTDGEVDEDNTDKDSLEVGIIELKLSNEFTLPLKEQQVLGEHDFISFLTGHMTKLKMGELISFQVVTSPILNSVHGYEVKRIQKFRSNINRGIPVTRLLNENMFQKLISLPPFSIILLILFPLFFVIGVVIKFIIAAFQLVLDSNATTIPIFDSERPRVPIQELLNPYEKERQEAVKGKIDQGLFETSIRLLIQVSDTNNFNSRVSGFLSSLGPFSSIYQSLNERSLPPLFSGAAINKRLLQFKQRELSSSNPFSLNPILSESEISDLYHFPYTDITKTQGLVKSRSDDLPAPLSMKKSTTKFDVIVGKNIFDDEETAIGLTLTQRRRHTYVIGKTGMGKTEMIKTMILQDMISGKGLAVLDPHGDLIQDLLKIIPEARKKDVIYFDPSDRDNPIGLNILSPGIKFINDEEKEDKITSSIIAIFQKLTPEEYWGPRMEHILRNTTLTALQTEIPTLWTLQQLLTDKDYQRKVSAKLTDPILKQFWDKEFANVGKMQMFSVTAPLTERLGLFITTKMSRHILLQEVSTISIQKIMDEGKIFLVNLSKGDLGEDQSFFFGTMITSIIWMAAYQRRKIPEPERRDFILYVDEFQNFATKRFADISSESRKFHVSLVVSHQNIAQIEDPHTITIVAGNADTIICLKAGPDDENFILPFMDPEVKKGQIVNLPPFHFFMKVTTDTSEEAFSGETQMLENTGSDKVRDEVISYSRRHFATERKLVEEYLEKLFNKMETKTKGSGEKPQPEKSGNDSGKTNKSYGKKDGKKRIKRYV